MSNHELFTHEATAQRIAELVNARGFWLANERQEVILLLRQKGYNVRVMNGTENGYLWSIEVTAQ